MRSTASKRRREAALRRLEAMSDPLGADVLQALIMDGPASATELAGKLGQPFHKVNYQLRERLAKLGCAELVEVRPSGGSFARIYRATERHLVTTEEWESLEPEVKDHHATRFAEAIVNDLELALTARTVGQSKDFHLTQNRIVVDSQGLEEILEIHEEARQKALKAGDRAQRRLVKSGAEGIDMSSCQAAFAVPPS